MIVIGTGSNKRIFRFFGRKCSHFFVNHICLEKRSCLFILIAYRMSWFFGGSNDKKPESDSFSTGTMKIDDFDSGNFAGSSSTSSGMASSGMGSAGSFEQQVMLEQQKIAIQAVVLKLTDVAYETCIPKPSSSLSSSEQSCIHAVVGKYLDTSELIVGRFQASNGQH